MTLNESLNLYCIIILSEIRSQLCSRGNTEDHQFITHFPEMATFPVKSLINTLAARMIAELGLPKLLHKSFFRDKLTIVMYHGVVRSPLEVSNWCFIDVTLFRSQVNYLKRNFEVLPLSEAVEQMRKRKIFRPTAVITFDDGFQNNYEVAFPILREAGLPATIFLTTGLVNTDDTLLSLRLNRALAKARVASLEWDGRKFDLSGVVPKTNAVSEIQTKLKKLAFPERLAEVHRTIVGLGDDPDDPIEIGSPFRMLSHDAIAEMASSGLIEFGAHSHTHPILSHLSPKERHDEITRSVDIVQELTGRPCKLFAYPNGEPEDYDAESIRILNACGVSIAVTTIPGPNDVMTSPMELKRYGLGSNDYMAVFELTVHHFLAQVHRIIG